MRNVARKTKRGSRAMSASMATSERRATRGAPDQARSAALDVLDAARSRWDWARHWEFWLALSLGAFLRLWHLELTQFLTDQRMILLLARNAILHGALPVTSVQYSVGAYAPPFGTYLLIPFAAFGKDPFPAVISIALWNVVGVALCYIFGLRYFGRVAAASGALLLATSGVAVNYSRFIWQPNYQSPLLTILALALFAGCVQGKPRWLVPSGVLLVLAIQINPVAIALLPLLLLALLLAPQAPRPWEYAALGAAVLVLMLPTILWEVVRKGLDFRLLTQYTHQPAIMSLTVLRTLYQALGAPSASDFGPHSLYATFGAWYPAINALAVIFFAAGYLVLTWLLVAPARRLWLQQTGDGRARIVGWLGALWHGLRAAPTWRANLLLWLWVTLIPLSMVRHTSMPTVHYVTVIFPAAFVVSGLCVRRLLTMSADLRLGAGVLSWRDISIRPASVLPHLSIALLAILVAAQAAQSALYPASLVSGRFDATAFYGFPLAEMQRADTALAELQRQQGVSTMFISLPAADRFGAGMRYLLLNEHPDRVGFADNCLVLPAPGAAPALMVSTWAGGPAAGLLPALPNARHVADITMPGGAPFAVYRIEGSTPALPDEVAVTPAIFHDASGNGLRLDAAALVAPQMLRLRWSVLTSTLAGQAPEWFQPTVSALKGDESAGVPIASTDCQPERWQTDETVFTWLSLATPAAAEGQPPAAFSAATGALAIGVNGGTVTFDMPTFGPLLLQSARQVGLPLRAFPPLAPATSPSGTPGLITSAGAYELAVGALMLPQKP